MTTAPVAPWIVISDYPSWPSPYFAQLQRHAPKDLRLEFTAGLETIAHRSESPGVVNLHRLKRLYAGPDGRRTPAAADEMLARLVSLRQAGWRLVWTVHNLLPIDGEPTAVDERVAHGVLGLADAVIAHTQADARRLASLTGALVTVSGWGGLPAPISPDPAPCEITSLAEQIAEVPVSILVVGNLTAYKGLPTIIDVFTARTTSAHLFVVGPSRDDDLTAVLTERTINAGGRVHLRIGRIPPEQLHLLYDAASAALCPYRTDGPWEFFARTLHPSSVSTAVAFGTPVIAPDLGAVKEITCGHPRWLYPPSVGPGPALAAVQNTPPPRLAPQRNGRDQPWYAVTAVYAELAQLLLGNRHRTPTEMTEGAL